MHIRYTLTGTGAGEYIGEVPDATAVPRIGDTVYLDTGPSLDVYRVIAVAWATLLAETQRPDATPIHKEWLVIVTVEAVEINRPPSTSTEEG